MDRIGNAVSGIGHYVITFAAIVCITILAVTNKVDGNTAVAIIAVAAGVAGGVGAAATGGKISANNTQGGQAASFQMGEPQTGSSPTPFVSGSSQS